MIWSKLMAAGAIGQTLHIGCGPWSKDGDVGIDLIAGPAVDIVHDLNDFPWPVDSDEFDEVLCFDVLEHLTNIPATIEEIFRVARDGALIRIKVPSGTSPDVFTDPTHLRGFGHRSFDYFDPCKDYFHYGYSKASLHVVEFRFCDLGGRAFKPVDWIIRNVADAYPQFYEFRLCHIFPMRALVFTLRVDKRVRCVTHEV